MAAHGIRGALSHDRRRLGGLSRLGYRTLREYLGAAVGVRDAAPGALVWVQSFGAVLNWHPHLHVLVTEGVFARDGAFTRAPAPDAAVLERLWQHAVLAWFVAEGWLEDEAAAAMQAWPHTGFGAHVGPVIAGEDRASLLRVARYGARAPVAEGRLRYDAARAEVELVSDARGGPYVGVQRMTALEFVARWVTHVPEPYETRVRYYGAYATRRRRWWWRRGVVAEGSAAITWSAPRCRAEAATAADWPALRARRRRWAELLRRVFQVEVEVCPRCGGAMRIVAFVTAPASVRRVLAHLARGGIEARAGPWAAGGESEPMVQ